MNEKLADGLVIAGRLALIAILAVVKIALTHDNYGSDSNFSHGGGSYPRDYANKNAKFYRPTGTSRGYGRRSY